MTKQPANVVFLAAELMGAAIAKHQPTPARAAILADQLCRLGRRYLRMSERLCGGEETWGRHPEAQRRIDACEARRGKLRDRIEKLAKESPFRVKIDSDGGGLGLVAITTGRYEETTSLR